MSFNHDAVAALPTGGDADAALIRSLVERRSTYNLAVDENVSDFVAADPTSGVLPLYLRQSNVAFQLDALDTTTTHDGVTCLVTHDGKRYKSDTIAYPHSVLTKGATAQPAFPSVGARYLIPAAATGADWAGKDGRIGIYTLAGWRFAIVPIGRFLYVEDESAFYHRNKSGTWTAGVGSIALGANSVNLTNVLGAKASFVIKVENQTTNAPPASPVAPTAYIIGPSPTGAWAGNAGKLAICLASGSFTIIAPAVGDQVFDKSLANAYQFLGTSWVSASGSIVGYKRGFGQPTLVPGGSGLYTLSSSVAPSTELSDTDPVGLTHAAKTAGSLLDFTYQATAAISSNDFYTYALMRDSESAAIDWLVTSALSSLNSINVSFAVVATDTLPHTYKFRVYRSPSSGNQVTGLSRRTFRLLEIAA